MLKDRQKALVKYFIEVDGYGVKEAIKEVKENYKDLESSWEGFLVLTDGEADNACKESILESVWAFNKFFLDNHSKAIANIPDKDFQDMQGKLCESFNKAVIAMIDDLDYFIEDAINCDGRGHFLSSYDGEETEITINNERYYIYKC